MRYESAVTARGNIGVSCESQAIAEAQAKAMDANLCTDCTGCTDCTDCTGCTDCTDCTGCTDCTDCTGCTRCTDCTGCELYYLDSPSKITKEEAIANLDKVREIILDQPGRLEMGHWHGEYGWQEKTCAEEAACGTTHCLAGWLQVCTTDPALRRAEAMIAGAVLAPVAAKMFFKSGPEVMGWLKDRKYVAESM